MDTSPKVDVESIHVEESLPSPSSRPLGIYSSTS